MAKPSLVVLGCGPVGLVAALRARQLGLPVEVLTDRMPTGADPSRIEVVPAQTVALLVEFGLPPRSLGIDKLEERRRTQWEPGELVIAKAPAAAHIARPALELGLLAMAEREGVRFSPTGSARLSSAQTADCGIAVLDATGRVASTATAVVRPVAPLVCRTFVQDAVRGIDLDGFSIAAGPDGYAYRLGNARQIAFGVVGHGGHLKGGARSVLEGVRSYAPWIVQGLDADQLQPGGSGAASLQWCAESPAGVRPIGDAHIARDALASQGLAIGFSDALQTVSALAGTPSAAGGGAKHQLSLHRKRVSDLVARSPFADVHVWQEYLEFLRT
jgi:hypothetical protein